jgi:hypothetical protein
MLKIQVNGRFLDLPPGTVMEVERESPILQFNEEVKGGHSLPVPVKNNDANAITLEYSGQLQKRVTKTGFDSQVYDGIAPAALSLRGKLKIEKTSYNIQRNSKTDISTYLVTDAASFYQDIKDKKLREIDMGGDRTFAGGVTPVSSSPFGVHVLNVAKGIGGPYDYAFFPVMNTSWGDDPGMTVDNDVMNKIYLTEFGMTIGPVIVPFPFLKYVILQAVEYAGWTIEGDILDDPDFQKIVMINFRAIDWGKFRAGEGEVYYMDIYDNVTFNLQDHLPDIKISEFFIALKDRFGWWYDFKTTEKKIIIRKLVDLVAAAAKDYTAISSPIVQKTVIQDGRIYALKNNFVTGGGTGLDITKLDYQGEVNKRSDLPAEIQANNGKVYLVREENTYWSLIQNPDDEADWYWYPLFGNIYDYVPAGANEDITTMATTVEMWGYSALMDHIPRIDSPGAWLDINGETPWGIHLCFSYGLRENRTGDDIPYGSHHIYDANGVQLAEWSLAFEGRKNGGEEVGLYELNWKDFLQLFVNTEEVTVMIHPAMEDYLKLSFIDILVVDGIKLIIKTMKHTIPYKNKIQLVCYRL